MNKKNKKDQPEPQASDESMPADEFARMNEEIREWKDKYMRSLAESENMRKRLTKERQEFVEYTKRDLFRDLLDPIDQFTAALGHSDNTHPEVQQWAMGFKMILSQLEEFLKSQNITPFESLGHTFDPSRHEALEVLETEDKPDGTILREFKRGYLIGNTLLRPAAVQVAKTPSNEETMTKEETQEGA